MKCNRIVLWGFQTETKSFRLIYGAGTETNEEYETVMKELLEAALYEGCCESENIRVFNLMKKLMDI
ncbi:hypothetical protein IW492_14710 [Enterococcus sp. BWB1-3]|uniref:hypothetical protein n=1 Tax=unclassified Enterococcus TaxID=2608891 RepID=UPI0019208E6F|nr:MULTISPECIES: hypothetical protein [unclassified Enterococcus]MBL1230480.1 hypothetical protein [Enterococcus sp. BWB1-3]MCB5955299.1 hypothetical protein [Enterococcus sp. CWB-B31]